MRARAPRGASRRQPAPRPPPLPPAPGPQVSVSNTLKVGMLSVRWHGAVYNTFGKIEAETIRVMSGGGGAPAAAAADAVIQEMAGT